MSPYVRDLVLVNEDTLKIQWSRLGLGSDWSSAHKIRPSSIIFVAVPESFAACT